VFFYCFDEVDNLLAYLGQILPSVSSFIIERRHLFLKDYIIKEFELVYENDVLLAVDCIDAGICYVLEQVNEHQLESLLFGL
jgi:hypothetical protein